LAIIAGFFVALGSNIGSFFH